MIVVAIATRVVRWPIAAGGAARDRTERAAVILEVRTADGRIGRGEAAPLPGFSRDTLADAARALAGFAATAPFPLASGEVAACDRAEPFASSPAARFAIETALLDLQGLLAGPPVATAIVVDDVAEARAAVAGGAPVLKLKIAPDRVAHVHAIAAACPGIPLRLDANRTFARADIPALVASLAGLPIEFLEEPCADAASLGPQPIAIALDESLTAAGAELAILKPTVIGGLRACRELAARSRRAIVTHALEGPIGLAGVRAVARALGGGPHGVGANRAIVVAEPTAATLETVTAALRARTPIALIHHRATPDEQRRQRALVEHAALPPDAAAILFTSGSTGAPRGVVLSHAALAAAAAAHAAHLGWHADDRWLLALSLAHAGGLAVVVRCLAADRPIVLATDNLARDLEGVTLASLVPTQLAALLDDPAWRSPARLRAVLLGGAAAPPALLAAARARGVPVLVTYGMTETFGQIATALPGDPDTLVALPGVTLTAGTLAVAAPIAIAAPMLATAYLDESGLAPIATPFVTRDLGYLDAGALHVVGRADDVIVTGGENVHPATVEAALVATAHVRAACAFAIPDARWGQLVGVAVVATGELDLAAWHAALAPAARPRRIALVDALPLLPTGKVDRRAAAMLATRPIEYDR